jgi:hypothetical protein
MTSIRECVAGAFAVAALLALAAAPALAQGKRPAPAALIAAAKATKLADFEVMEELRGLTVEAWMKKLYGNAPVAWRAKTCREVAGDRMSVNSPICVEAAVHIRAALSRSAGFDEEAPRPERKPNDLGLVMARKGLRVTATRPDPAGRKQIDEMSKAGAAWRPARLAGADRGEG